MDEKKKATSASTTAPAKPPKPIQVPEPAPEVLTFGQKLTRIQNELVAPKSSFNEFGNYNYRNVEDIYNGLKPLLKKYGLFMYITDEIVEVGSRCYVRTIATISDGDKEIKATALARETASKKGMDEAQITGSTSSYARKYCLGGLFLIDDCVDPDSQAPEQPRQNNYQNQGQQKQNNYQKKAAPQQDKAIDKVANLEAAKKKIAEAKTTDELNKIYAEYRYITEVAELYNACAERKLFIQHGYKPSTSEPIKKITTRLPANAAGIIVKQRKDAAQEKPLTSTGELDLK